MCKQTDNRVFLMLCAVILICALLFAGCSDNKNADNREIDYSQYSFVNISWTRDGGNDIETIRFGDDGSFTYYCACGNPVNDSDLCEGYTYDDETKTITLECIETTDEMVTVIKIVNCDENELHLDFDGDIRVFTKESR
ncbi:MAG: hypothetical protein IKW01_05710 [Firmicutes bacterium]|nr:hypothetical protein [Bacillota bacterium]